VRRNSHFFYLNSLSPSYCSIHLHDDGGLYLYKCPCVPRSNFVTYLLQQEILWGLLFALYACRYIQLVSLHLTTMTTYLPILSTHNVIMTECAPKRTVLEKAKCMGTHYNMSYAVIFPSCTHITVVLAHFRSFIETTICTHLYCSTLIANFPFHPFFSLDWLKRTGMFLSLKIANYASNTCEITNWLHREWLHEWINEWYVGIVSPFFEPSEYNMAMDLVVFLSSFVVYTGCWIQWARICMDALYYCLCVV